MAAEKGGISVAILSSGLGHINRGVEGWSNDMARALHGKGIRVELLKGAGKTGERERVIPCIKRDSRLAQWLAGALPAFAWRIGLGSAVQMEGTTFAVSALPHIIRSGYDIIHTKEPPVAAALLAFKSMGLIRSEIVMANGTDESRDFLSKFDYVQVLAPYYLEEAARSGPGKRRTRWFAIPNFIDPERFRPGDKAAAREKLGIDRDATVILAVAAIKRTHKRLDYFLSEMAALAALRERKITVLAAGARDRETGEIIKLGEELLGSRVRFYVDRPRDVMQDIYRAADLFVMCSLREVFGTVFLEAMASGIAAIGHDFPVTKWIIGDGGECIDMSVRGNLRHAVDGLLQRDDLRELGEKARRRVLELFSKDRVIDQTMEMYKTIAKDGTTYA